MLGKPASNRPEAAPAHVFPEVGGHSPVLTVAVESLESCLLSEPIRLLRPWDFPGENAGVGCHSLLQGIFPTQGSSPRLLPGRRTRYH